jgi:hypothetical protein
MREPKNGEGLMFWSIMRGLAFWEHWRILGELRGMQKRGTILIGNSEKESKLVMETNFFGPLRLT